MFKALVRNFFIIMNVRYSQAIAKWVDTKLIKTISSILLYCIPQYGYVQKLVSSAETRENIITSSEEFIILFLILHVLLGY